MATKDYKNYATKEITPTMEAFCEWLQNETGLQLDARSVALAGSLRMDFQKSEFWKSDARNYLANVDANRAAKAAERAEKAQAAATKAVERAKAAADKAKAAAKAAADKAASDAKPAKDEKVAA